MARLRMDPTTWLWIIAGEPAARPAARPVAECPFCPGQEGGGEIVIAEKRDAAGGWTVRVLADRAPVLHAEGEPERLGDGLYDHMNAVGAHEIVVEGPGHNLTVGTLPAGIFRQTLEACRERILDLKRDPRFRFVEAFQNQGREAGALLDHPHAQIIASPMVSARVERELRASHTHYQIKERCLYCDLVRQELAERERVVEATDDYVVFCPFASRVPYEMWILPRRHDSSFERATEAAGALDRLAVVFQAALGRAEAVTPVLNWVLHTEPNRKMPTWLRADWETLAEDYHWHIEITPRLRQQLKALPQQEFFLNQVLPEEAARCLRSL